jgi:putative inorganic carbon (hco3(-)) transporter
MMPMSHRRGTGGGVTQTPAGQVGAFTFFLYMYFLIDFFLRFSSRVPAYGTIRPTLLVVALLTFLLILQRDRLKGWTQEPIMKAMLAFLLYLVLSLLFVEWPGSVIRHNLSDFVKAIVFLFFTVLIVDSEKRLKIFLAVFIGCQLVRILEPLYMHLTTGYWGSRTYLGGGEFSARLAGAPADVINPNELGFVIVTAIPFLHYLLWSGRFWAKLFYLSLVPALLYALILTQSRGAFLALLVISWIIFKESNRKTMLIVLAACIAFAGWNVMSPQQKDRYLSLVGESQTGNTASAEGRLRGMVMEFELAMNRPLVGHGLGTTPEAKTHVLGDRRAAHNFYAEILIETGIIGFAFFIRFLLRVYRKLKENGQMFKDSEYRGSLSFYENLNKSLVAVFWMYVVYSTNYWGLSQYYWYLFAGLVVVFSSRLQEQFSLSPESQVTNSKTSFVRRYGLSARKVGSGEL